MPAPSPTDPAEAPRAGPGAWARRLPIVLQVILTLSVAVPAAHFELDRWRRDSAAGAHREAGDRALASGEYEASIVAYGRALEIEPADARLLLLRSRARAYLVADQPESLRPEQLAEIRYDVTAQLRADPDHAAAYWTARAVISARLGDRAGASAALDSALARDPGFPSAHFALADQALSAGKPDDARKHFEAALERRPNHVGSLLGLASMDLAAGRADPAIERLRAALAVRDELTTRLTLVDALVKKGALPEALAEAQRSVARDPQAAESHRSLGMVANLMDRLPEAERAYRAALAARATPQGYVDLAGVLGRLKRSKDALATYKRALREEPKNPMALLGAAVAAEDAGLPAEALEHLQKLLALTPEGDDRERLAALQDMGRKRLAALEAKAPPASTAPGGALPGAPGGAGLPLHLR